MQHPREVSTILSRVRKVDPAWMDPASRTRRYIVDLDDIRTEYGDGMEENLEFEETNEDEDDLEPGGVQGGEEETEKAPVGEEDEGGEALHQDEEGGEETLKKTTTELEPEVDKIELPDLPAQRPASEPGEPGPLAEGAEPPEGGKDTPLVEDKEESEQEEVEPKTPKPALLPPPLPPKQRKRPPQTTPSQYSAPDKPLEPDLQGAKDPLHVEEKRKTDSTRPKALARKRGVLPLNREGIPIYRLRGTNQEPSTRAEAGLPPGRLKEARRSQRLSRPPEYYGLRLDQKGQKRKEPPTDSPMKRIYRLIQK